MLRRSLKKRTLLLLCAGFVALSPVCREALAQTLDEANRLFRQAVQLDQQGNFRDAIPVAQKALDIRIKRLGEQHYDTARSYNLLGMLYNGIGHYGKAEPLLQKAFSIFKMLRGEKDPSTVASYNNLGMLYCSMGDYNKAEPLLQKALTIKREILGDKHPSTAGNYSNLSHLYFEMTEYGKAEPLLQKALAINIEVLGEKHPSTATTYNNLGTLYKVMDDFSKAKPLLEKALTIRKKILGDKHPDTAQSYSNLGLLFSSMGEYGKAEPLLEKALGIRREVLGEKNPDTANSYNNLGEFYDKIGDYDKAEPLLQRALTINIEILGEKHLNTVISYGNLGNFYKIMAEYAKAEPLLRRALTISKEVLGEKHLDTAFSYGYLASLYKSIGEYAKAEPLMQKALAIQKEVLGETHTHTATSYNNLGTLYMVMGEYSKAEPLLQKALRISREILGEKHPSTARSYSNLGYLYLSTGEIGQALEIFTKLDAWDGLGVCHLAQKDYGKAQRQFARTHQFLEVSGQKEYVVGSHIGLGLAAEGLGDYREAKKEFNRAVEIMESQRAELGKASRESFLGGEAGMGFSRLEAYEGMIRVLRREGQRGYEAEALRYGERVKARVFLEMLATRGVKGRSDTDQKILAKDHDLRVKLTALEKEVQKLGELGDKAPKGRLEEAKKELTQASEQYENFLKEVKLKGSELASLLTVEVPAIEILQAQLEPGTTLLEYFTGKEKTYAWLMTRERVQMFEIPAGAKKVEELVNTVLLPNISNRSRRPEPKIILAPTPSQETGEAERKTNREHFLEAQKEIHQTFFSPVKEEIKTSKLIIVPHGALHKVPFSALSDGTRCLAEDYGITLLPSASVLPQVTGKRKADKGELLALGNPTTDAVPLGFAEKEVETISKAFRKKQVYTKEKATKVRMKKESGSPSVLHLACHGEFNDRQPLQSGLLLAREGDDDGRLQVHDVFSLDLKNTNLVTLSACETALGKVTSGDDMVGLSRAFLYASTPSLIASLWQVDDASTALLMERFYDNWRNKKMSKSEALRQAQLSLKAMPAYQHPYFWAGFELIGDWQ